MFVFRHKAPSMSAQGSTDTSPSDIVWFVDSRAFNRMKSHEVWFRQLRKPNPPGYVEIGDDTNHPIRHIGNVPFGNDGKQTYLKNVSLKNMVLVG